MIFADFEKSHIINYQTNKISVNLLNPRHLRAKFLLRQPFFCESIKIV